MKKRLPAVLLAFLLLLAGVSAAEELPSLKETYAPYFDFGTAVTRSELSDIKVMRFVKAQFAIITAGNEMKPDSVLDVPASARLAAEDETAVAVKFDAAKTILRYAQAAGLKVHGHTLLWHNQTPPAFFHEGYDLQKPLVTREVMLGRMEHYIAEVMAWTEENFPGLIVSWDVVNEAVDDGTGKLRESPWLTVVGEDYVARAFEYARKYAPEGVLLYYNDYNTAMLGKQNGIVALLEALMAEGNIDGYGFQMHHGLSFPSVELIGASVRRIAALGLRLRVSELDITIDKYSEANLNMQAVKYGDIMKLLLPYSDQLEAVQVWGITDTKSWRAPQYPLLFTGSLAAKPAFWAVIEAAGAE